LALHWYRTEVDNGGHDQFYFNSMGIVWPDALTAFEAIGVPKGSEILRESAQRLGASPSRERKERQRQLDALKPDFGDLDNRFHELERRTDLDARMLEYARTQGPQFYFEGVVERLVLGSPPVK
jgi:hypothetical protein